MVKKEKKAAAAADASFTPPDQRIEATFVPSLLDDFLQVSACLFRGLALQLHTLKGCCQRSLLVFVQREVHSAYFPKKFTGVHNKVHKRSRTMQPALEGWFARHYKKLRYSTALCQYFAGTLLVLSSCQAAFGLRGLHSNVGLCGMEGSWRREGGSCYRCAFLTLQLRSCRPCHNCQQAANRGTTRAQQLGES